MPQQASSPGFISRAWFARTLAARGLSQRQLARRLGVDAASVSRLANGHRPITLDEVVKLARILMVPARDVLVNAGIELDRLPLADYTVDFGRVKLAGPEGG